MRRDLARLDNTTFDVVIIGGGMSGACLAYDAALRGLSVALVERGDFGGATSAASSKLLHGGIRYLQQLRLDKVRESARERAHFQRIAPHLAAGASPSASSTPKCAFGHCSTSYSRRTSWA